MAASSSRHLLSAYAPTAAPPPTPSTQPNSSSCSDAAADTLSRLLHRLPPNLSLPTRFSPRAASASATTPTPTTPLPTLSDLSPSTLCPAFELGFFQLDTHPISSQLAESAESESLALFDLSHDEKLRHFPKDLPTGFDSDAEDEDETESFCIDGGACSTSAELRVVSLGELTRELEKVGMEVVESLASAVGFENPFKAGKMGPSSLMWVSEGEKSGRVYPYVVGLQYQIRSRKYSLLSDSETVVVEPKVGSVLVTLGDIAQVWSNGKIKKVRGRPAPILQDNKTSNSRSISMTMLLTLPLESTVSPLSLKSPSKATDNVNVSGNSESNNDDDDENEVVFNSFSFEDYAWRVYHERLLLKDPLDRYRVTLN